MNRYGLLAQQHWMTHAPTAFRDLENPEKFFTQMGDSAAFQIDQLASELESRIPTGLEYLEQAQQISMCRRQAEEQVLAELVYSREAEPSTDWQERLEEALGSLPAESELEAQLAMIQDQMDHEAELEGWGPGVVPDDQTQERIDLLNKLLALVRVPAQGLSGRELETRVLEAEQMVATRASW